MNESKRPNSAQGFPERPPQQPASLRAERKNTQYGQEHPFYEEQIADMGFLIDYARLPQQDRRLLESLALGRNPETLYKVAGIKKDQLDHHLERLYRLFGVDDQNGLIDAQARWAKTPYDLRVHMEKSFSPVRALKNQESLTAREKEILQLMAEGKTSNEIAHDLEIGPKTVENHKQNMRDKLGVANTAELIAIAKNVSII